MSLRWRSNIVFALYFVATTRQRCIRVIIPCSDEATLYSRYITLQRRSNAPIASYFVAMTKQRSIRVILPFNDEATLYARYISQQQRGNIAFALITRCNDKTTLHSRYNVSTTRQRCIRFITLQLRSNIAFAHPRSKICIIKLANNDILTTLKQWNHVVWVS